jgi:hypothetical protein
MTAPTVHLNGTSAAALLEGYEKATAAVTAALTALCEATAAVTAALTALARPRPMHGTTTRKDRAHGPMCVRPIWPT